MWTLRRQFLLATLLIYALVTLAMLFAANRLMRDALLDEAGRTGARSATLLSASLAPLLAARDLATAQDLLDLLVEGHSYAYLRVAALDGRTIVHAGDAALLALAAREARPAGASDPAPAVQGHYHFVADVVLDGRRLAQVSFGISDARASRAERSLLTRLALLGLGGLAIAGLAQLLLARVLTRGLERLADGANRMAAGDTQLQLPVAGGSQEVDRLTTAFNRMAAALAERIAAIEHSELRQRLLTAGLTEGVVFQDAQDRVLSCNEAAWRILGLTREQLLGSSPRDPRWRAVAADGSPFEPDQQPSLRALRSGAAVRNVVMGVDLPGASRVWVSVNSQPLTQPGANQAYATVTSYSDITAAVQAEHTLIDTNTMLEQRVAERTAELAAARDLAEQANRAKSEFLSRMSHELRTPLNAILGFAQVLRMRIGVADASTDEQLRHVETAGWHLLELINDVLDLSRIDSGTLVVSADAVALAPLVSECVRMSATALGVLQIALDNRVDGGGETVVLADPTRLRQVVLNLISNAAKYNRPHGRVTLDVAGDDTFAELRVADTGVGLTAQQIESLYQPFNRLGAERRRIDGTGIGLVITKRLVELMGGSLLVHSLPGVGTTFTVRLQRGVLAALPSASAASAPAAHPGEPMRSLLYVEDNPSNLQLLAEVMKLRPQVRLLTASDGKAGLELAIQARPDIVVVDIAIPGIDGYTLCRRLRATPGLHDRAIVALSANAMKADKARGTEAGFDHYFTKPLEVDAFLRWLDDAVARLPAANVTR